MNIYGQGGKIWNVFFSIILSFDEWKSYEKNYLRKRDNYSIYAGPEKTLCF